MVVGFINTIILIVSGMNWSSSYQLLVLWLYTDLFRKLFTCALVVPEIPLSTPPGGFGVSAQNFSSESVKFLRLECLFLNYKEGREIHPTR
jgi:hypothetical protein